MLLACGLFSHSLYADLIPRGAQWRYLDNGFQSGWRYPEFDDSTWATGLAPLGYGDGDEATVTSYGSNPGNKRITTYFRHQFEVSSMPALQLTLRVQRDDGVIAYLNGVEVYRNNIGRGKIGANTLATSAVHGADEAALQTAVINPQKLVFGTNTLAVEVHLSGRASPDLSFDLQLTDSPVIRGPYLQQSSDTGITVRWRTRTDSDAVLRYGKNRDNLNRIASDSRRTTEHAIKLNGLEPDTRYYYSIGSSEGSYSTGKYSYFDTHPEVGSAVPTRIWVLGDSGTADSNAASVRSAFTRFNRGTHSDVWLMLGDNAYDSGTDEEYQAAVFDLYPNLLRNSVLWPTLGNHDAQVADSDSQTGSYYDIFTLPANAESGGVASGTEAYYSFDYGNIHFISLDSHDTNRSANGAMARWLKDDLAANTQEWIIAYWHHPPYSKGSHDSDTDNRLSQMRSNFLPILESHGVDLVLAGHSHSYERSILMDGHYGTSDSFKNSHVLDSGDGNPTLSKAYTKRAGSHNGAVYSVAGSSGKVSNAPLNHPVMISNLVELGSMVIDVNGKQLDAIFLDDNASVRDRFRIVHQPPQTNNDGAENPSLIASNKLVDHNRVRGPAWTRVNFDVVSTGDHTIQVNWPGNADIRFSLFRVRTGTGDEIIATIDYKSPARWVGRLDSSQQYYLGVWSAAGSGRFTAVLESGVVTIGEGALDANGTEGPRGAQLKFDSLSAGEYTINVGWDNSDAAVVYKVKKADGTELSPNIRGANPGTWTGRLEANTAYFIGMWSTEGAANYVATITSIDD